MHSPFPCKHPSFSRCSRDVPVLCAFDVLDLRTLVNYYSNVRLFLYSDLHCLILRCQHWTYFNLGRVSLARHNIYSQPGLSAIMWQIYFQSNLFSAGSSVQRLIQGIISDAWLNSIMWQIYFQSNLHLFSAGSSVQTLIQGRINCYSLYMFLKNLKSYLSILSLMIFHRTCRTAWMNCLPRVQVFLMISW